MLTEQLKVSIGMAIEEVQGIFAEGVLRVGNGVATRDENIAGLSGQWNYRFSARKKLNWVHFDKYYTYDMSEETWPFTKTNFNKCLAATNELIETYSKFFDKPDTLTVNDTTFAKDGRALGYEIKKALWKNANGMKIIISFKSNGGHNPFGGFYYLVTVNQFPKTYPYES